MSAETAEYKWMVSFKNGRPSPNGNLTREVYAETHTEAVAKVLAELSDSKYSPLYEIDIHVHGLDLPTRRRHHRYTADPQIDYTEIRELSAEELLGKMNKEK